MMNALADMLLNPAMLITLAASLAAFFALLGFALPYLERDREKGRLRAVAERRRELRFERLEKKRRPSLLRRSRGGRLRTLVDRLKLRDALVGDAVRVKLAQAGLRGANAPAYYATARLAGPLILGGLAALTLFGGTYKLSLMMKILVSLGWAAAGFYLPALLLTNAVQRRQAAFSRAFPDALDLLLICVESGLSMEAGLSRVAQESAAAAPVLVEEVELTSAELAYLPDRRQALENLAQRVGLPSVRAVTSTLIQAEKYGTPLAAALRVAAQESRDARMAAAEKKAGALPAKLTVPMVLFFLPVLFIVILGPAIIQMTGAR